MPVHERIGLSIVGMWVNRAQNEFIWVRTFTDTTDREAKAKAFQAEVAASGIKLGGNVAKMKYATSKPRLPSHNLIRRAEQPLPAAEQVVS